MIRIHIPVFAALALIMAAAPAGAVTDDRDTVRDVRAGVVHNTWGNCVRTKWMGEGDVCAPAVPPPPPVAEIAPPPPKPMKRTIVSQAARTVYFPFNKTALTDPAQTQLDTLADTLKSAKDIRGAQIVGTADRIGSSSYNDKLSQKRAETVRDYLVAHGYTNASVTKTRWLGKSSPTTSCAKKMKHAKLVECLQHDRRVEIEIVYRSEVESPAMSH